MLKEPRALICYYDSGKSSEIILYNCLNIFELLTIFKPTDRIIQTDFKFQKGILEDYQFFSRSDFRNINSILDLLMITELIGPELEVYSLETIINNEIELYITEGQIFIIINENHNEESKRIIFYILENICALDENKSSNIFSTLINNNKKIIELNTTGEVTNIYDTPKAAGFHWYWND